MNFKYSDFTDVGIKAGMIVELAISDIKTGNPELINIGINAFIDYLINYHSNLTEIERN